MSTYNLISISNGWRAEYGNVAEVRTLAHGETQTLVTLFDKEMNIIVIINLAPGERLEREGV